MYYYYYYGHNPESQYTVFRSHPIYPYLSVLLNKIFFIESEIVEDNQNLFSEVYDLLEDEDLKNFDFITLPVNPKNNDNSIISELNIKSSLSAKELERFKHFYSKQEFCKPDYLEFIKAIRELFGFENIHQGGLLWFEPYIHGYRVIFMSAEKFILNTLPKNLRGMFLERCNIDKLIEKFESELKQEKPKESKYTQIDESNDNENQQYPENITDNSEYKNSELRSEIPSVTDLYSEILDKAEKVLKADFKKENSQKEYIRLLSALNDLSKKEFKKNRNKYNYKLEIKVVDGRYGIFVPGVEQEITLTPVAKSFYFLTLLIKEGIKFKDLQLHEKVLNTFYLNFSRSTKTDNLKKTISYLIKDTQGVKNKDASDGITIEKTRARQAFRDVLDKIDERNYKDIISEIVYRMRTSDLIIDLGKEDIRGYEHLSELANKENGYKITDF